jgi:hypothetical protein
MHLWTGSAVVKVDTMSDEALAEQTPSTEIQWNLLRLLDTELAAMGVTDREMASMEF